MAQKKRAPGAAKAKAKGTQGKGNSAPSAKALTGEPLVVQTLKAAKVDAKVAGATAPAEALDSYFLDAARALDAYRDSRAEFVGVPTFKVHVADAGRSLLAHAKAVNREWQKVRFEKQKGSNRKGLRKDAEKLRSTVLGACRFLFRDDTDALAEVDRIAEGEGLADLIQDMEDIVLLAGAHAALFAKVEKLAGTAEKAEELGAALQQMKDGKSARDLLASRNRAVGALDVSVAEIRGAARFLHGGDTVALAPYASSSLPRVRASRADKGAAKKADKKAPKLPEPDDIDVDE